jgi:hypothetical protein
MKLAIVLACAVLLLVGVVLVIRWGGYGLQPPPGGSEDDGPKKSPTRTALRRYVWRANLVMVTALISGVLTAWAGGRLVMRILAATSPPESQGQLTEAQELVGEVTLGGSFGLFFFGALPAGFVTAAIYLLIHRWLPAGRLAGPLLGLLGLLVFGATIDPLRADNIDFDIVGPGWLAVVLFSALVILHGALVAAVAARMSHLLPLPAKPTAAAYLPLLAAVVFLPAGVLLAVGGLIVLAWTALTKRTALTKGQGFTKAQGLPSRPALWAGRAVLVLAALAGAPVFAASVASIIGR